MICRKLNIIDIIDWYDGVVLALVSLDDSENTYVSSLLAYDLELKQRIFALLPLKRGELSNVKKNLNGDWEKSLLYLNLLWKKADGNTLLILYSDEESQILAEKNVLANLIKDYAIADVEVAVSSNRKCWFDMF